MKIPTKVQRWLELRQEYERQLGLTPNPPMPKVLPIEKIGRKWFFVDERLRQYRNVMDPDEFIDW